MRVPVHPAGEADPAYPVIILCISLCVCASVVKNAAYNFLSFDSQVLKNIRAQARSRKMSYNIFLLLFAFVLLILLYFRA